MTDQEVISKLEKLVNRERESTLGVVVGLSKIEERKLFLSLGYGSLFDYCTRGLKYSEPAANRRIKAARCIRKFPEVYKMLKANEVNLTTVCLFGGLLNESNKEELLSRVSGQSKRSVENILLDYQEPLKQVVRDEIKPVRVVVPYKTKPDKNSNYLRHVSNNDLFSSPPPSPTTQVEEQVKICFSAKKQFRGKLEQAKSLLSSKYPTGVSLEVLFEEALDCLIEAKTPKAKNKVKVSAKNSRYIPQAVKEQVFKRDEGCCSYVGQNGVRCGSKWDLEIDHVHPYALGGDNSLGNLRLLCSAHNRMEAEKYFGKVSYPQKKVAS